MEKIFAKSRQQLPGFDMDLAIFAFGEKLNWKMINEKPKII